MKIGSVQVYRYDLPLAKPLPIKPATSQRTVSTAKRRGDASGLLQRSGLIIQCTGNNGAVGLGEVAPLPTFSPEDLDVASRHAVAASKWLTGRAIPNGLERLDGGFARWLGELDLAPSVRCGLELAVLNVLAQTRQVSLRMLLCGEARNRVTINGLLTGSREEITEKARKISEKGYKAAKLKVGRGEIAEDITLAHEVRDTLGNGIALRLDANRAWDESAATAFCRAVSDCAIDYIEEPLGNPGRLEILVRATPVPIALDETVIQLDPDEVGALRGVKALVLKPTLIGGFERAVQFARAAKSAGITPVISSAFEAGVGLIGLANVAACIHGEDCAAGLDTASWFQSDVLDKPPPTDTPQWDLNVIDQRPFRLEKRRLEKVGNG